MPSGSRAQLFRINQIAELVPQRMEEVKRNSSLKLHTQKSLAEIIGWSMGTIRDDIEDMKALGYPITFDTKLGGYVFTEKFSGIPTAFITESDLAKLCLALRVLESLKGSKLFRRIQKAVDKLTQALIDKFGMDVEALKSTVTFRSTGVDALTDPALLETLMHAINRREELELVYSKLNRDETTDATRKASEDAGEAPLQGACGSSAANPQCEDEKEDGTAPSSPLSAPARASSIATVPAPNAPWLRLPVETRRVHPLHILCRDNTWYLYLWDPVRKALRRFVLSRIHSLHHTGKKFRPRKFDIDQVLDGRIGVTSGDPVHVKIQFRRKASFLVAERPWHHSQKLVPGPDTEWNVELTLEVAHTPELEREIFGFHQDARVIEPPKLRQAVASLAAGITANYSTEG